MERGQNVGLKDFARICIRVPQTYLLYWVYVFPPKPPISERDISTFLFSKLNPQWLSFILQLVSEWDISDSFSYFLVGTLGMSTNLCRSGKFQVVFLFSSWDFRSVHQPMPELDISSRLLTLSSLDFRSVHKTMPEWAISGCLLIF